MRVLFVLPDLPRSGAATRTVHLAEQLAAHGDAVAVATFLRRVDGRLAARLRRSNVDVIRLRCGRDLRHLQGLMSRQGDAVVHAAMPTAGLLGLWLARATGRPLVYSYTNCLHTHRPFREVSTVDHLKAALERIMAGRSEALHAVSSSVADQLRRTYPHAADRIRTIPLYVTAPVGDGPDTTPIGFRDASPRLLCIGRLLPHKRFDDAIRAVASLRADWPTTLLLIVGSGPEHGHLQRLVASLELSGNVHLVGSSPNAGRLFSWADVLVHPSVYEGYPRVFAEARAHNLPVISVDAPYAREYAHSGGQVRLARPVDGDSLATTILRALTDRTTGSLPAPQMADEVNRLRDLYRHVLAGP